MSVRPRKRILQAVVTQQVVVPGIAKSRGSVGDIRQEIFFVARVGSMVDFWRLGTKQEKKKKKGGDKGKKRKKKEKEKKNADEEKQGTTCCLSIQVLLRLKPGNKHRKQKSKSYPGYGLRRSSGQWIQGNSSDDQNGCFCSKIHGVGYLRCKIKEMLAMQ